MRQESGSLAGGPEARPAGSQLRPRVEETGSLLADALGNLVGSLPGRPEGPQMLADQLGITVVTASRLLRAIDQNNPVAVIQQLPGPVPLRRFVASARSKGAPAARAKAAARAVEEFEKLIREYAGDRSILSAMVSDWLPEARHDFEVRRRQTAFKAFSELRGVSCALDLATIVVQPSEEAGLLDLLSLQGTFGLDRIRPDAVVQFGTLRLTSEASLAGAKATAVEPEGRTIGREPTNLKGEPVLTGKGTVRLDRFCGATPAPLESRSVGEDVMYSLGSTGFGPESSVDLVLAELNRAELRELRPENGSPPPYFFHAPDTPSRRMLFDMLVHKEVYGGLEPQLLVYDTCPRGCARACAPDRELDRRRVTEEIESLGSRMSRLRYSGFPRYLELLDYVFGELGWNPDDFRAFRLQISYPLHGSQYSMVWTQPGERL